jgi:hypothetical protein
LAIHNLPIANHEFSTYERNLSLGLNYGVLAEFLVRAGEIGAVVASSAFLAGQRALRDNLRQQPDVVQLAFGARG